jgi:hypothetical protein
VDVVDLRTTPRGSSSRVPSLGSASVLITLAITTFREMVRARWWMYSWPRGLSWPRSQSHQPRLILTVTSQR